MVADAMRARSYLMMPLGCALVLAAGAARAAEGDPPDGAAAKALVVRALAPDRLGFQAGEAELGMQLQDAAGHIVERTLRARIATAPGGARQMRITFLAPSDQAGVEFLLLEAPPAPPQQYLWLPRAGELRKLPPSDQSTGFQGSDFTLEDLTAHDVSGATVTELGAPETIGGVVARRFAITAGAGAKPESGAWREVHVWIAESLALPLKIEFIAADGVAKKRFEVKRIQTIAGARRPTRLVMSDLVKGTRTTLDIVRADPAAVFPASIFRPEALGR